MLSVGVLLLPGLRRGVANVIGSLRAGRLRPWQVLGGAGGAWLVSTQGLTVPTLGVALFMVAVVAGQSVGSLMVDAAGLGPAGKVAVTRRRLLAAGLALTGVVLAVAPRLAGTVSLGIDAAALATLALSAGVGVSVQQAVNARVAVAGGSAPPAAVVNFAIGTSALLVVLGAGVAVGGWTLAGVPGDPWLYAGGPLGVAFIAIAAWIVPLVGVLRFALSAISGQLLGGALIDLVAPQPGAGLGPGMVVGIVLVLSAVLIASRRP